MITTPQDYYNLYHRIQSENAPSLAILLPTDEKIYLVDLNSRTIEAPKYLSVEKDHRAEVIYFKVNRFYDFFDLTQAVCVVQYKNALGESRAYAVPYYDVDTLSEEDMILFPWIIDKEVTKAGGIIEYNIRFYKLSGSGKSYLYNLNTLPARSEILHTLDDKIDNMVSLGYISQDTFSIYKLSAIPLYVFDAEKDEYILSEIYQEGIIYYINQEQAFLAALKDDIYQKINDIQGFDLYWEES